MENERKLTEKKIKRKDRFDILRKDMQKKGYSEKELIITLKEANGKSLLVTLPFVIAAAAIYYAVNSFDTVSTSFKYSVLLLPIIIILIVLHELIHGLVWGVFARNHFRSIEFGVIWKAFTPYCTCSEPMTKWQYITGAAMPTIVLGFGTAAFSVVSNHLLLFLISELMIISGGGDFLIILKTLLFHSEKKESMYCDHPYECGLVVFER